MITTSFLLVFLIAFGRARFLVEPKNVIVAPDSVATFHCVIRGDDQTNMVWELNDNPIQYGETAGSNYKAVWHNFFNSTLYVNASITANNSKIECAYASSQQQFYYHKEATLRMAGPPLQPASFIVHYDETQNSVNLQWEAPFTYSPEFPIVNFTVQMYCLQSGKEMLLQTQIINGNKTRYSMSSDEFCPCSKVCVHLTARNGIGNSAIAESCTDIVKDTEPFPINSSITTLQDGETWVTAIFQKPHCVPQGMLSRIVVKEVPSMKVDDLYNVSTLSDLSEDEVMRVNTFAKMQENTVYEVKVHLQSETVNILSLPTFVYLSSGTVELEKGNESDQSNSNTAGIAIAIAIAVLLFILLVVGMIIFITYTVSQRSKRDTSVITNPMQPNPLYEGALYCTIPTASPKSYDNHIYQAAPGSSNDKISDLYEDLPPPSCTADTPTEQKMPMPEERTDVAEGDYIIMRSCSVSGSPMPMQTDV